MPNSVAIIGLGYVGLPLACLCVEKGMQVYGADIDKNKLSMLSKGISPIDDPCLNEEVKKIKGKITLTVNVEEAVKSSSVIVICVPTPVDEGHLPDLKLLKDACESVSKGLQKGSLVVVESTIFPGTVEEIVQPILKKSNVNFHLAHCPERIDPGNKKFTIKNLPRVVAGIDEESTKKASEFYSSIIDADIMELNSVKAAEATKIMENTFRDINIAFVNEMAKSFDKAGIDILEVIKGASTKPFAFMPHYPGAGVGGHCIAVDPYYLISKAKQIGFNHDFLILARKINESMPAYAVELLENGLKKLNTGIKGAKVGVLGLAYKADVDDIRESPALKVIEILKEKEAQVFVFDPYIKNRSNVNDLKELLERSDYLILVTAHKEFKSMDLAKLKENNVSIIIDGRNCLDKEKIKSLGILYHGIGRS
ncbi:nucleotide sugar dehydrogenase [Candidatus Woesearchaeota archaeon]|nr:nucleotide sugar dehydrogenase [Candidatus Woesearchaeota archaeon]